MEILLPEEKEWIAKIGDVLITSGGKQFVAVSVQGVTTDYKYAMLGINTMDTLCRAASLDDLTYEVDEFLGKDPGAQYFKSDDYYLQLTKKVII